MPQGGIDADENPRDAVMRELWEETGVVSADYLGETDWLTYEFPPFDGPPTHRLAKFRGQRQKWFALRFTGSDDEIDPLTPRNGQPAEFDPVALGAARPRRRSRGAVPARGVSDGGAAFCGIRPVDRMASQRAHEVLARRLVAQYFCFSADHRIPPGRIWYQRTFSYRSRRLTGSA